MVGDGRARFGVLALGDPGHPAAAGSPVTVGVRPEHLETTGAGVLQMTVDLAEPLVHA